MSSDRRRAPLPDAFASLEAHLAARAGRESPTEPPRRPTALHPPCPDRTPRGYLRWRTWAPFFTAGFWTALAVTHDIAGPWGVAMAAIAALGLPAALALWDTRRTEGAATRGDDQSRT